MTSSTTTSTSTTTTAVTTPGAVISCGENADGLPGGCQTSDSGFVIPEDVQGFTTCYNQCNQSTAGSFVFATLSIATKECNCYEQCVYDDSIQDTFYGHIATCIADQE